jgi:nicotinamide mononucleotide adenylyltransferase
MNRDYDWLVEHVNVFEQLSSSLNVGLYPGAFKPPHVGHYEAALAALKQNDVVVVMISGQSRGEGSGEISAEQSREIWDVYKQYNGDDRLKVVTVPNFRDQDTGAIGTVLTATYDVVHLLNTGGEYSSTGRFTSAHPVAQKIYDSMNNYDKYNVTVYAGKEDFSGRYSGFPFDVEDEFKRYTGVNVLGVKKGLNKRLASASGIRPHVSSFKKKDIKTSNDIREQILAGSLSRGDFESIRKNLPGDEDVKDKVVDILLR